MKKLLLLTILFLASCTFGVGSAWGIGYCVTNATELQAAFTAAASNGEDDIIMVVQGTYSGNFTFSSGEGHGVILQGGYTAAGCAGTVVNPANTILQGGGSGGVLSLSNTNGGNIQVDGFTIRNGNASTVSGGGVYARSYSDSGTAGTVDLSNNIITGNTVATYAGGGVYAASISNTGHASIVTLYNNIIAGNTASSSGGGINVSSWSNSFSGGTVNLLNNTITGNDAGANGGGIYTERDDNAVYLYNNIIWGNIATSAGDDIFLTGSGTTYSINNNYHELSGTLDNAANNIDADPLFVGGGNYHLRAGSPCIDTGNNGAVWSSTDIDGDDRIIDGNKDATSTLDMGADEYCDPFKIGGATYYYSTIHEAYDFMTSGTLQMKASEFIENLVLDQNYIVTLQGGYGCGFTTNVGTYSTINGSLTIGGSAGKVTVENIKIK